MKSEWILQMICSFGIAGSSLGIQKKSIPKLGYATESLSHLFFVYQLLLFQFVDNLSTDLIALLRIQLLQHTLKTKFYRHDVLIQVAQSS